MRWTERQRAMLRATGLPAAWLTLADAACRPAPLLPRPGEVAQAPATPPATPAPTVATAPTPETLRGRQPVPSPSTAPVALPKHSQARIQAAEPPHAPLDERSQAIAQMDWPALNEAAQACRACALGASRTQAVLGVGHQQAHWMLIGEAPGEQEDKLGEPFVGAAGHLLDQILAALGLTREQAPPERQVYIANTLKCRPPRNRNPEPAELAACAPFLQRQIELIRPRVIVAMGRFAIQQLLHTDEAVGRLRGRVHEAAGVPLIVTYHPAYLLRQPADKAKAWADWCLAADALRRAGD